MEITATLENWVYDKKQNVIIGDCYGDVHERFSDGSGIVTSQLKPMSMQLSYPKEGLVIFTLNSSYKLGKKK